MLYSAKSGWWKIPDFGLTSSGTSQHLRTTHVGRGRASYRAPEMIRDSKAAYNKKVDIWSLGRILYELCVGKKAFQHDIVTFQFAAAKEDLVIEFEDWLDEFARTIYGQLIREMLQPQHENRPSIESLCQRFIDIVSLVSFRTRDELNGLQYNTLFESHRLLPTFQLRKDFRIFGGRRHYLWAQSTGNMPTS